MQGRIGILAALLIEAGALATATSALGLLELHRVFKPLTMVLAIALVVLRARSQGGLRKFDLLLVAGLAFSLAGDVLLMLPGNFIAGLVAFLLAHLFYIVLFRQGVGWLPRPWALAGTLAVGGAMYALLFPGLGPVLKPAVAAYVVVIGFMAAQAIGRAAVLKDKASLARGHRQRVLHAQRLAAGAEPLPPAAAAGAVLGAVDLLRGAGADRAACATCAAGGSSGRRRGHAVDRRGLSRAWRRRLRRQAPVPCRRARRAQSARPPVPPAGRSARPAGRRG